MVKNPKAILIGDYANPPYHPLHPVEGEITEILSSAITVQSTGDYQFFTAGALKDFQLCISYTDCWDRKLTPEQVGGLLSFVSNGGSLLVIHNGISIQSHFELAQLVGARFTGHPAMQKLCLKIADPDHPIMAGIDSFEMIEEPYQFFFDNFGERTLLLEYELDKQALPAAWAHPYGLGKVAFLMPGHDLTAFKNETYRQIILQSVRWLIG
jgi:uncharacterized protein